jgi:hypothetical protein
MIVELLNGSCIITPTSLITCRLLLTTYNLPPLLFFSFSPAGPEETQREVGFFTYRFKLVASLLPQRAQRLRKERH